ncbi:MAG: hypothetical protein AAF902_17765, partial [Chloroflexota bacterium]
NFSFHFSHFQIVKGFTCLTKKSWKVNPFIANKSPFYGINPPQYFATSKICSSRMRDHPSIYFSKLSAGTQDSSAQKESELVKAGIAFPKLLLLQSKLIVWQTEMEH